MLITKLASDKTTKIFGQSPTLIRFNGRGYVALKKDSAVAETNVVDQPVEPRETCRETKVASKTVGSMIDSQDNNHHEYILVVVATLAPDSDVRKNQKMALDLLRENGVPTQKLDASDPLNETKCSRLFALSGCKSFYPQFFHVVVMEKASGVGSPDNEAFDEHIIDFWGDWFYFDSVNKRKGGIATEFPHLISGAGPISSPQSEEVKTPDKPVSADSDVTEEAKSQDSCNILGLCGLILYTIIILAIPPLLMFGHSNDRPKLIAWIDRNKDNLIVPSGWVEEFNYAVLGKDGGTMDRFIANSSTMGSFWNNPLGDSEFFVDIFQTQEVLQEHHGNDGGSSLSTTKRMDPFDWFDGTKKSLDPQHDNFFRKVAHFFRNKKTDSTNENSNRLEEMISNFLGQRTEWSVDTGEKSLPSIISLLFNASAEVGRQLNETFGHVGLERFNLMQFLYYMEDEESRKIAVWKRRTHRYRSELQTEPAKQLYDGLYLSQLAYAPSCEEIYNRLQAFRGGLWALRNCTVEASVHQPAHFVVVRCLNPEKKMKDLIQGAWRGGFRPRQNVLSWLAGPSMYVNAPAQQLEMAIVVRGSKEIFDFLTDGMLVASDYQDGKAHDGILKSALWLEEAYQADLKNFWKKSKKEIHGKSGKKKMKLWLIGHSLGGGTAALATMQFRGQNYTRWLDAEALGFGTPSLVSPSISYQYKDYITTVINDADVVPRMSGRVMAKAWLKILAFNWTDSALNDYDQLIELMESDDNLMRTFFGSQTSRAWFDESKGRLRGWLQTWFDENLRPWLENLPAQATTDDISQQNEAELIPPGECVHFYRDGVTYQASFMNCSFFDELEIVRNAVDDHLIPPGYYRAILGLVRNQLNNPSWSFDDDILAIDYP